MRRGVSSYLPKDRVGIVGGGWYGCHVALYLAKKGYDVTLLERNSDIFSGLSGTFGVRLHAGPHYPRSPATRKGCREGFGEFYRTYPHLINEHEYSIYALGTIDANGKPSKVTLSEFDSVCREFKFKKKIDPIKWGYQNLLMAADIEEPSVMLGTRLRKAFKRYLKDAGVKIECNFCVTTLEESGGQFAVVGSQTSKVFNHVVNATSYQGLLSPKAAFPMAMGEKVEIIYQPCLALVYEDEKKPLSKKPISFIVMDGWFPCLMPYDDRTEKDLGVFKKYIMTHGKWTITGSYKTSNEAKAHLAAIDDDFVLKNVKSNCEAEMIRFWPAFKDRFKYISWVGAVLAKIKTEGEFRSAVTFQDPIGVIHIVPGKVSNVFDAGREVASLISRENVVKDGKNFRYVEGGVLDNSIEEIMEAPRDLERNTCALQPYTDYFEVKKGCSPLLWTSPTAAEEVATPALRVKREEVVEGAMLQSQVG